MAFTDAEVVVSAQVARVIEKVAVRRVLVRAGRLQRHVRVHVRQAMSACAPFLNCGYLYRAPFLGRVFAYGAPFVIHEVLVRGCVVAYRAPFVVSKMLVHYLSSIYFEESPRIYRPLPTHVRDIRPRPLDYASS